MKVSVAGCEQFSPYDGQGRTKPEMRARLEQALADYYATPPEKRVCRCGVNKHGPPDPAVWDKLAIRAAANIANDVERELARRYGAKGQK